MFTGARTFLILGLAGLGAALSGALLAWGLAVHQTGPDGASLPRLALVRNLPPAEAPAARPPRAPAATPNGGNAGPNGGNAGPNGGNAGPNGGNAAPAREARLALVIDDIGHSLPALRDFLALGVPMTFSVLPDLPHSRAAAELIAGARGEYIIHLPMEPQDYPVQNPGPNPLLLDLGLPETQRRLRAYLEELPGAIGASNHMGSAYTYDQPHMAVVQDELARRSLLFLNSKTSASPVPAEVAQRGGYRYLERDVFLDNEVSEGAIERELRHAVGRARRNGHAIAIGHPHPETYRVVRRALESGELDAVNLVSLSTLRP